MATCYRAHFELTSAPPPAGACPGPLQERKAAVIRAEGESESAKLISEATKQVGPAP